MDERPGDAPHCGRAICGGPLLARDDEGVRLEQLQAHKGGGSGADGEAAEEGVLRSHVAVIVPCKMDFPSSTASRRVLLPSSIVGLPVIKLIRSAKHSCLQMGFRKFCISFNPRFNGPSGHSAAIT